MRFDVISDCHLEFDEDLILNPNSDTLLICGDLLQLKYIGIEKDDTFQFKKYNNFLKNELSKYKNVIYIFGNHEYYSYNWYYINKFEKILLSECLNLTILKNEEIIIDDIPIYGGTMWTDLNNLDINVISNMEKYTNENLIKGFCYKNRKKEYDDYVKKLKIFLNKFNDNEVVVLSHHSPVTNNIIYDSDFNKEDVEIYSPIYCSNLDDLILENKNIKYWCHGHIHKKLNYFLGDTNIITNPRGYPPHKYSSDNELFKNFNIITIEV